MKPNNSDDPVKTRIAAGKNPKKRRQILDAAARVFAAVGFDKAAMDDVCTEAGTSKSTLYVYFPSKEHLFAALVCEERDRYVQEFMAILRDPTQPAETLFRFGCHLARRLTSRRVVRAHRTILSVAERLPEIGMDFYAKGPERSLDFLAEYLKGVEKAGLLRFDDPRRAASQLSDLVTSGLLKPRLFGVITEDPSEAELEASVTSAVRLFMAGYAVDRPQAG
ncbi:TetR/AcrR family transcriptional regulator [Jiella sp. M17.18]|uniref:TetR/AcrR family transcriptional regulator n=1 Tax=Jiella sp. M17.18 TaxID=3234247 RepID=UPI0034DE3C1B